VVVKDVSARTARLIVAALLEDDDFEDEDDFKEVWGEPTYRTFNLEFDFGAGEDGYSTVINVPAHFLPVDDEDGEATQQVVRDYAFKKLTDQADVDAVGSIPRDDWDWLVTIEETDPQPMLPE
jgi:hypothetical protein